LIQRVASMEIDRVIIVFLHAGGHRQDVGVKNDVLRRKTDPFGQNLVTARADFLAALQRVGLALSSKAMTTTAAP